MASTFNIFLLNIRSLKHKLDELRLYLSDLELKSGFGFDVIALTETWLRDEETHMLQLDGFSLVHQQKAGGRGGGVALYVRNGIFCNTFDIQATTQNSIGFRLETVTGTHLSGLLIYRFPKSNKGLFLNELANNILGLGSNAIVFGDVNIDLLKTSDSLEYSNLLASHGFTSYMNRPTREVAHCSSCLDHFYLRSKISSGSVSLADCCAIPTGLSDHHTVVARLRGLTQHVASPRLPADKKHIIRFTDWAALNSDLFEVDWEILLSGKSVNQAFSIFYDKVNFFLQKNTKYIKKPAFKIKRNPWASELLIRLAKQKNDLYLLVKKFPNNVYLKNRYKLHSKKVQAQADHDRKKYFGKLLETPGLNSRKYWQIVGKLAGREKKGISRIEVNSVIHEVSNNELLVADAFNEYFVGVTESLADANRSTNSSQTFKSNYTVVASKIGTKSFFMFPITTSEIINAISSISNKNSIGTDGISIEFLRECMYSLLAPLEILFNLSVVEGCFPDQLKTAIIVPIFKSGLSTIIANYRPIAILSVISKLLELIVKNRVIEYLLTNKFFSDRQFGFLPGRSTDGALLSHLTDVVSSLERNSVTVSLYLDISKAFDTVDHSILLDKLQKYGFRGTILHWFSSYLSNRNQRVRIGDSLSSPQNISSGVPQGSTLGPLLFLIYVNELLEIKISGRIFSFADDTSVLFTAKTKHELLDKIKKDLKSLTSWFYDHKLYVNLEKTKLLNFGRQKLDLTNELKFHSQPNCPITCNCPFLDQVSQIKYLGVILDQNLNWGPHSEFLQKKIRKLNFTFYHLSKLLTRKHLLRTYRVLYEPVLRYGIIHWGHSPKKYTDPIKVLHKFSIRILAGLSKRDSTTQHFEKLDILNFDQTFKLYSAKYAHKYIGVFGYTSPPPTGLRDRGLTLRRPKWQKDFATRQAAYSVPTIFNP